MSELVLAGGFRDPGREAFEAVERKGLGHPDTLADGLAHAVSCEFALYTLNEFGLVLHHNVDKLYVGGGWFRTDYGTVELVKPVDVVVNGRMSRSFAGRSIPVEEIQRRAVESYVREVLPALDVDRHLNVKCNTSTFTDVSPYWYEPRDLGDLPEYTNLMANDTAVCVASHPATATERLAYGIEQALWMRSDGRRKPRFDHVGQDVKVMVVREDGHADATVCLPILSPHIGGWTEYCDRLEGMEAFLSEVAAGIADSAGLTVSLRVNPGRQTRFRKYILGIGSCVECGEEGLVGRGNASNGVISMLRPHSMEAACGKNPKYHTGRVLSFLAEQLSRTIYDELRVPNSVMFITRNQGSLVPPYKTVVFSGERLDRNEVAEQVARVLSRDYTELIIRSSIP